MTHSNFVHLRVHSAYSLSEGAIKIPELVELCVAESMPAVAVTDTANMFGALEFALAAAEGGVQPIIGCQLAVQRPGGKDGANGHAGAEQRAPLDILVLLVQNEAGYRNLIGLVSRCYLETEAGEGVHVSLADVEAHADGLIALTGGPDGAVGRLLADGQAEAAEAMLVRLADAFPGRLYVELMRHRLDEESTIEGDLVDLAFRHDVPLVATNDCYFSRPDMFEAHDALLCIAAGAHVTETDRRRLTPDHRFRSAAEMRALFADLPEAVDNTLVVARRCAYMPQPRDGILPAFPTPDGMSEEATLRAEAEAGLQARLKRHGIGEAAAKPYRDRLEYELGVISEMGYPGYFLIVADFIQWAKRQGIPVGPGRGSGAGSVVAWALTITDLDPLRFGLLFERFLNPERVSMPDFDIDFCQDRRDEVIHYVQDKYGADRVAQIITFGKLQARAVLRDVGRVLGMPYGQVDRICKLVPYNPARPPTLQEAIDAEPELQNLRTDDEQVARLLDIGMKLEGLYRHASTHAAGVVIGDRPLDELLPLYRDPRSDMTATQFSMKYTELAGLVKFDFLGLKTLTVLDRAVGLLKQRGIDIDLGELPLEDAATYDMLGRGETIGVFQLESAGMRDVLRQMQPDKFEDIIALVALYRPGPMDNIPRYISCKRGREEPDYLHPDLEGILKETFGVMIYQEQVMQIAQVLSGFSLGHADILRRAMGKKIKSEMAAQRADFVDGAVARGVPEAKAGKIFDQVDKFAGYGFNKSHAAAYALVAYQTAWLKANYPVEFLAASMTLDLGNTDKLNVFKDELKRLGIPLLPPDINDSGVTFTVRPPGEIYPNGAVCYALAAVKNVGAQAMSAVVAERDAAGPFRDVFDFAERVGNRASNKRQLENLVRAGAFDSLDPNRRSVFDGVETLLRVASAASNERDSNQASLFGDDPAALSAPRSTLPEVADWPETERLENELDAIGFYLSKHPLDDYAPVLERLGAVRFDSLTPAAAGTRPRLAGLVRKKRERTSAKGSRFAFVEFSSSDGIFEVVVFSEILSAARELLDSGRPLLVSVDVRADGDGVRLSAQAIEDLEQAAARTGAGLKVTLDRAEALDPLKQAIHTGEKGNGRVSLVLDLDTHQSVEIALPGGYAISPDMRAAIRALPGVREMREI
jgi:DNA polymerase-3 subunit alpha